MIRPTGIGLLALVVACSGGGGGPTEPNPTPGLVTLSILAGNNQSVRVREQTSIVPAVIARNAQGQPVAGITVQFSIESGGGTISGATQTTGADGIARVENWIVGPTPGSNTLVASAQGVSGSPLRFTATARYPHWTVMVYLAADNNLAVPGVIDIEEMEQAGVHPDVQVVVQAEFSQVFLARAGCGSPACINRPNFNTFRYVLTGQGGNVIGPNGPTTDLGNRDMTNPSTLREFVSWTKQNHPAERYALVLWNHGGGYEGLIQDLTSAGTNLMGVDDLRSALSGNMVDLLDFDMCLMGGVRNSIIH